MDACLFCGSDLKAPDHARRCHVNIGRLESAIYPQAAGWKATDTSREAAESMDAATVRELVAGYVKQHGPHTADETAKALGLDKLTVRPRFTELKALGRAWALAESA